MSRQTRIYASFFGNSNMATAKRLMKIAVFMTGDSN